MKTRQGVQGREKSTAVHASLLLSRGGCAASVVRVLAFCMSVDRCAHVPLQADHDIIIYDR